ncbi:uncharacterized protein LOC126968734 [Leptidea sinapis]|uniref:uncharacterized protein LOC126968734 n=1 Tax=Leptidea sinapis TaxID=189913 RepID=UPI002132986B|nr:uncharacterized protein LOC126968734 [Leptidea sinapis]XP_050669796.1 uncharacterized protein LOC126968734 [Leptidea sinapis]XP_050669797.1 uncharacterized protein LOC126968734 [Leptidea sinapis]XP_050669798.1 uncharacterized protein LOC126968734 [Leptidea sinapis]
MTLHWWMHWFWVTAMLLIIASGGNDAAPQSELEPISDVQTEPRYADRQPRAMYFTKTPLVTTRAPDDVTKETVTKNIEKVSNASVNATDVQIQWTPVNTTDNTTPTENISVETFTNVTESSNTTYSRRRNLTRPDPDYVKEDAIEGLSESRIVTEKPLSLETTFLQTRIPPNIESSRRIIDRNEGGMDTGAIAGISFAALVIAALAGSTAFVLYRRRYLNKPQTLNDKCSNPDSSGYLDDSTIRDNSEEMYSLDNDSFLNSLEAMTIQNYWTDTVKHTKL